MANSQIAARADSRNPHHTEERKNRLAAYAWAAAFAVCALLTNAMVPDRHDLAVRIATDAFMAFGLTVAFPLLLVALWREGPGIFFRWLFWSVAIVGAGITLGVLHG